MANARIRKIITLRHMGSRFPGALARLFAE